MMCMLCLDAVECKEEDNLRDEIHYTRLRPHAQMNHGRKHSHGRNNVIVCTFTVSVRAYKQEPRS